MGESVSETTASPSAFVKATCQRTNYEGQFGGQNIQTKRRITDHMEKRTSQHRDAALPARTALCLLHLNQRAGNQLITFRACKQIAPDFGTCSARCVRTLVSGDAELTPNRLRMRSEKPWKPGCGTSVSPRGLLECFWTRGFWKRSKKPDRTLGLEAWG